MKVIIRFKGGTLELPCKDETHFYHLVYALESNIKGVASISLYQDTLHLICRTLGKPPRRVFNHLDGNWYPFEYFQRNSKNFPLTTRFLYATYLNKFELTQYGFF